MERWLITDENEEAVSALEFLAEVAPDVTNNVYRWKWVILATHGALQGFMVTALRRTDGSGPVPDKIFIRIIKADKAGAPHPEERLDTFLTLYRKIGNDAQMRQYVHNKRFVPTGTQNESVRKLHSLRNNFIHFTPKGWSLEVTGLPRICVDCLDIIRFLAEESGNILWHDQSHLARISTALATAGNLFRLLKLEFEKEL